MPSDDPGTSPLFETNPSSLDELFSRDPHELTVGSKPLSDLIAALRVYRAKWAEEEARGKTRSSAKRPKVAATGVSLASLGLLDKPL